MDAQHFLPLFLNGESDKANELDLYRNGYLVEDNIMPENLCNEILNEFEVANVISAELYRAVFDMGILKLVIEKIYKLNSK